MKYSILGLSRQLSVLSAYKNLMDVYREHVAIVNTFRGGDLNESLDFFGQRIGDADASVMFEDYLITKSDSGKARSRKSS